MIYVKEREVVKFETQSIYILYPPPYNNKNQLSTALNEKKTTHFTSNNVTD